MPRRPSPASAGPRGPRTRAPLVPVAVLGLGPALPLSPARARAESGAGPGAPDAPLVRGRSFPRVVQGGASGSLSGILTPGGVYVRTRRRVDEAPRSRLGSQSRDGPRREPAGRCSADSWRTARLPARGFRVLSFLRARVCRLGGIGQGLPCCGESRCAGAQSAQPRSFTLLLFVFLLSLYKNGKRVSEVFRKGNNIPECESWDSYLFNIRCFQEWLFFKALKCTHCSTITLGCLLEQDHYSLSQTVTLSMLCTISESIALVPLLVSAGRFVDKRTNSTTVMRSPRL